MGWLKLWWGHLRRWAAIQEPRRPVRRTASAAVPPHLAHASAHQKDLAELKLIVDPKGPTVAALLTEAHDAMLRPLRQELGWWYHCGMDQRERCAAARAGRN